MFGDLSVLPIATMLISGGILFTFTALINLITEPFRAEVRVS